MANLRSFQDTGYVELRPLTVLLGANGSGKSTFLRFFPLLRQTAETRTRGPILWFHDDLVDFGDFAQAVRRGQSEIVCGYQVGDTRVEATIAAGGVGSQTKEVRVWGDASEDPAVLKFSEPERLMSFNVGNVDVLALEPGAQIAVSTGAFFSTVALPRERSTVPTSVLEKSLISEFRRMAHGRTTQDRLLGFVRSLAWSKRAKLKDQFISKGYFSWDGWEANINRLFQDPARLRRIQNLLLARAVEDLVVQTAFNLEAFSEGVAYLGPFRATPQRYYRHQDLAVDLLDPRGGNLAMFLRSMSQDSLASLDEWLTNSFGFGVGIETEGNHEKIHIRISGRDFNLVDVGFGYSQVLPIVVQLWALNANLPVGPGSSTPTLLAIEQPELHLHPRQQTLLGRAFALAARADGPRLLVETHSEAIISEIGLQVAEGKLGPKDVQILCFEQDPVTGTTEMRTATYNDDGNLSNWPVGFLSAAP